MKEDGDYEVAREVLGDGFVGVWYEEGFWRILILGTEGIVLFCLG